jgi:hypothetical protein
MPRTYSTMLVLALLLAAADPVGAQVRLEQKFPDGTKSTLVSKIESQQVLKFPGMEQKTSSSQTRTIEISNGQRAADGTIRIKQEVKEMQAELSTRERSIRVARSLTKSQCPLSKSGTPWMMTPQ